MSGVVVIQKMLRNFFRFRIWLVALLILVVVAGIVFGSSSFEGCIDEQHYRERDQPHNDASYFLALGHYWHCTGHFIHENGEEIIAIFTALLVIATIFLWSATRGLVSSAEETTRRSLRAYPGITGADIRIFGNDVRIRLTVQNFSTTPAYRFKYAIGARVCELESTDGVLKAVESESIWDMAPRSTTTMKHQFSLSGRDEKTSVVRGQTVIVIAGRADYDDAFGGKRWIKFRYRTIPFSIEEVKMFHPDGAYRPILAEVCTEPEAIEYDSN